MVLEDARGGRGGMLRGSWLWEELPTGWVLRELAEKLFPLHSEQETRRLDGEMRKYRKAFRGRIEGVAEVKEYSEEYRELCG